MSGGAVIFFLSMSVLLLLCITLYQQFAFRTGTQTKLKEIGQKLEEILDTDSDEKVMVFTNDKILMNLAAQINRMLENRQKIKVDFRRSQLSSKKMLSNISHDIKTPMTVILGYLEIIRLSETIEKETLYKVEEKTKQVMALIDQFFTLAKLEAKDTELDISKLDICQICRENILDFYELLTKQVFEVNIDIPEEPIYVYGNEEALQRILFNLISNAIRYGSQGKYIGLTVRSHDSHVLVDIIDHGKGIEKAFAQTVFDRLFTMEDSRNKEVQGNGLGLTIAQNLARQLGGDITLKSEPHQKTVFTVTLRKFTY